MKIKNLINLLQAAPDKEREILIPSIDGERTEHIGFSFDDLNDIELYKVDENSKDYFLQQIKELEKDFLKNNRIEQIKKKFHKN